MVQFLGRFLKDNDIFVVTEWAEEGDVSSKLQDPAWSFSWKLKVGILRDVARAMTYLHTKGTTRYPTTIIYHTLFLTRLPIPLLFVTAPPRVCARQQHFTSLNNILITETMHRDLKTANILLTSNWVAKVHLP